MSRNGNNGESEIHRVDRENDEPRDRGHGANLGNGHERADVGSGGAQNIRVQGSGRVQNIRIRLGYVVRRQGRRRKMYTVAEKSLPSDMLVLLAESRGIQIPEGHSSYQQPGEYIVEFTLDALTAAKEAKNNGSALTEIDINYGINKALEKMFGRKPDDEEGDGNNDSGGNRGANPLSVN